MERFGNYTYDIGSVHWVEVAYYNDPHNFYVRPTSYKKYQKYIQAHDGPIDASNLHIHQLTTYRSKICRGYVRGMITFIKNRSNNLKCDMYTVDVGLIERNIPIRRIYKSDCNIPPLAVKCMLANCIPIDKTFDAHAIEAMRNFVTDERLKMVVKGKAGEHLIVDLITTSPDDIATLLILTGHATHDCNYTDILNRPTNPKRKKVHYPMKTLNVGDVLYVQLQSGTSLKNFYVAEVDDYKEYLQEKENFTSYCKAQNELRKNNLSCNTPVAVFDDKYKRYERALIKKVIKSSKVAKVQLVDWGNIVEVNLSNLKSMKYTFLQRPVMAIYCAAEPNQNWDENMQNIWQCNCTFKITIKRVGNGFISPYIVTIAMT